MDSVRETGVENTGLDSALGRVLAEDVISDMDMPPFDKSTMDGYACRSEDILNELSLIETIPAGYVPEKSIGKNECAKIMTGAMVPAGANCVIKIEDTENISGNTIRFTGETLSVNNICCRAEDVKAGDVVLSKGEIIRSQHIAVLASAGCTNPLVARRPKIGIIATGSELVEPSGKAPESKIRNSNSYQLFAQALALGALPVSYGIAADKEDVIDAVIKKAMAKNEVILLSGGVSMGDFDLVPEILKKNGFRLLFKKVGIKPGKPATFGISDPLRHSARCDRATARRASATRNTVCFGLAGNPVSTFILFEILVKPYLYKMMGHDFIPHKFPLSLGKTVSRKRTGRESIIPVEITGDGKVIPVEYHGSAHINSMCGADGLISVPVGVKEIKEGTTVLVRQI